MENILIYHNPRCTKSRQTLDLIKSKGIEPLVVEYLKTPPLRSEIKNILKYLNIPARELMRTKEPIYKESGLDNTSLSEDELIQAMAKNPILIERPIVVKGEKAVLGRPPENVLELL